MTLRTWCLLPVVFAAPTLVASQSVIEVPDNKYSIEEDVELGRNAAREVRKELPVLDNGTVAAYVDRLGQRLVSAIPESFEQPAFTYTFEVVDVDGINAFALPGGPMFLHRGMLEAAINEAGIAGVMAHEISHVALRHGTAQATKGEKFQWGALAGSVLGAVLGGTAGRAIAEGTRFGLGAVFLKYSREYEKQADLLGAQIMARAGYDPRELGAMFELIEASGGSGAPEWLSSHPNPGNRVDYIAEEAEQLEIVDPVTDSTQFDRVRASLAGDPSAPTDRAAVERPEPPSAELRAYVEPDLYALEVPANWRELPGRSSVTFAPENGYVRTGSQRSFSHGVQIGVTDRAGEDLASAHDGFIASLVQGNPRLTPRGEARRAYLAGRRALASDLTNYSQATGWQETVSIRTTILPDGRLCYLIAVAPEDEHADYVATFERVADSVRLLP